MLLILFVTVSFISLYSPLITVKNLHYMLIRPSCFMQWGKNKSVKKYASNHSPAMTHNVKFLHGWEIFGNVKIPETLPVCIYSMPKEHRACIEKTTRPSSWNGWISQCLYPSIRLKAVSCEGPSRVQLVYAIPHHSRHHSQCFCFKSLMRRKEGSAHNPGPWLVWHETEANVCSIITPEHF